MSIPRKSVAAEQEKPFWGFTETGKAFRSETQVNNAVTGFVREVSRQIRDKFLSPHDVSLMVQIQPDYVRSAFPNSHLWSQQHRPWEWFAAQSSTGAEETLKRCIPDHLSEPEKYRQFVEDAERFHHYDCRFKTVGRSVIELFGAVVEPPTVANACRVHRS